MDLFPVAVRGSRNYFVWQNCGGVRVQVLEFLQHSVCTGTLYCVLIARTQGPDVIQRGGITLRTATAAAAKAAAGALWQPGGRAGPGTLPTYETCPHACVCAVCTSATHCSLYMCSSVLRSTYTVVDIMSIHEQVALNVSSAESKYHKM